MQRHRILPVGSAILGLTVIIVSGHLAIAPPVRAQEALDTYLDEDPRTHWDNIVKRPLQHGDSHAPELVQEHYDLFHNNGYRAVGGGDAWEWLKETHPGLANIWIEKQKKNVRKEFRAGDRTALGHGLALWSFLEDNGYSDVLGQPNPVVVIKDWIGEDTFENWRKSQSTDSTTIDFPLSPDVKHRISLHVKHINDWLGGGGYLSPENIRDLRDGIRNDPNLSPGDKAVLGGQLDDVVKNNRRQIVEPGTRLPDRDLDGIPDSMDQHPDEPGGFADVKTSHNPQLPDRGDVIDDFFGLTPTPPLVLTQAEVDVLLQRATAATPSEDAIVAVVDRGGRILGVRLEDDVLDTVENQPAGNQPGQQDAFRVFAIDGALAKARTAAFFANNQAPLTSRTIQGLSETTITQREVESNPSITNPDSTLRGPGFVAPAGLGDHFPSGAAFTPQVDLFAIESTNRDSTFAVGPDNIRGANNGTGQGDDVQLLQRFNVNPEFIPAHIKTPGETNDSAGRATTLAPPISYGEASGSLPHATSRGLGTLPGGIPIYKKDDATGQLVQVGGIGVFFPGETGFASEENSALSSDFDPTRADRSLEAEFIAFAAVGGSSQDGAPIGTLDGIAPLPGFDLPSGRIDLVGLTLDVFGPKGMDGPRTLVEHGQTLGAGVANGKNQPLIDPGPDNQVGTADDGGAVSLLDGTPVPEGFLVTPHASADGLLSETDVKRMIFQSVRQSLFTRSAIRLPLDSNAVTTVTVCDKSGEVLGQFRMPDSTVFSIDVSTAKARNVAYYANPTALQPQDQLPGVPAGTAFTNRTFRYLALPRFPEGSDGNQPGPFSQLNDDPGFNPLVSDVDRPSDAKGTGLQLGPPAPASKFQSVVGFNSFNPGTNFHDNRTNGVVDPTNPQFFQNDLLNRNGISFFPGSAPIYKNDELVGGFGVSGDGVDQDDIATLGGSRGFDVPDVLRVDSFFVDDIRLPFQKFNRQPNLNLTGDPRNLNPASANFPRFPGVDSNIARFPDSDVAKETGPGANCPVKAVGSSYRMNDRLEADENGKVEKKSGPPDDSYNSAVARNDSLATGDGQWGLQRIGLTRELHEQIVSAKETAGRPIVVAVIDSGVDLSHPELWGQLWRNRGEIPFNRIDDDGNGYVDDVYGYNTQADNSNVWDDNGHGTAVAGIIAARWDDRGMAGVAPNCRVMIVKAFNRDGKSDSARVALAIRYAVLNGANIIHISAENDQPHVIDQAMIDWATENGVLVIAASGSRGRDTGKISPAGLRGVLTVGAVDQDDRRVSFSGWGQHVDLVAPGVDIMSLRAHGTDFMYAMAGQGLGIKEGDRVVDDRWYRADGTSFAAPLVTGVAAALWAVNPDLTAEQIKHKLIMSCDDVESPGWDLLTGAGRLNAAKALAADADEFLDTAVYGLAVQGSAGQRVIQVIGRAGGTTFQKRTIDVAVGEHPSDGAWTTVLTSDEPAAQDGLGSFSARYITRRGVWTVRSTVEDNNGTTRQSQIVFDAR